MDFNENKLINQTYENDWLIEETYRQSDFHQCHFNNITTQDIVFENCYFYQTMFNQCDLSNIKFDNCMFRQVQFNNCKLLGSDFSESSFDQVIFNDCLCHFANFSFTRNKETLFNRCDLSQAIFQDTTLNKTKYITTQPYKINNKRLRDPNLFLFSFIPFPAFFPQSIFEKYSGYSRFHSFCFYISYNTF